MIKLEAAHGEDYIDQARVLFREYQAAIGLDLCFQNFDVEVANLPGVYAPPEGRLIFAYADGVLCGCIGLRQLDLETCEMKRLFVRPQFRGTGAGRLLTDRIIAEARAAGYKRMRLDTLPGIMDRAIALYRELGFTDIPAYYYNPVEGALFMELDLA
jgi:GNAT superfamily N-acetyltransferase